MPCTNDAKVHVQNTEQLIAEAPVLLDQIYCGLAETHSSIEHSRLVIERSMAILQEDQNRPRHWAARPPATWVALGGQVDITSP